MFRQKGSELVFEDEFHASSGLIIRHLVLPGHVNNSIKVLNTIAENLSNQVYISLMAQYYPTANVKGHQLLGRAITAQEYELVVNEMERLGFENGWIQELGSNKNYRPDFNKLNPFE
jgi:putative pyruvate formate lyase activating enzyme